MKIDVPFKIHGFVTVEADTDANAKAKALDMISGNISSPLKSKISTVEVFDNKENEFCTISIE
jgi:hypothetical protein